MLSEEGERPVLCVLWSGLNFPSKNSICFPEQVRRRNVKQNDQISSEKHRSNGISRYINPHVQTNFS